MARKDATVKARELARAKLAAKLAEQRKREEAIEKNLAAFFETDDALAAAAAERDAVVAKATKDYEKATAKQTATRATALSAIKEQGETVAGIAELTGLTVRDVRTLLADSAAPAGDDAAAAANTSDSAAADSPADPGEKPSAASPSTDPAPAASAASGGSSAVAIAS